MTIQTLATEIAKREGKKSEARIGDIREILAILSDVMWDQPLVYSLLSINGQKRAKKKLRR